MKECSYCQAEINTDIDSYFTCLDNFIQTKYFDDEEKENVFCCQECFCNYVQLEEIEPIEDEECDNDESEIHIDS